MGSSLERAEAYTVHVNVSQLSTLDRQFLLERIGGLPAPVMREVEDGIRLVLGL